MLARERAMMARHGARFPLIIWSHGSTNDAIDYAFTEEAIASHGFVVASPQHTANTQDDVLTDFANTTAGSTVIPCLDALPPPCAVPASANATDVNNRVGDVSALIDEMQRLNHRRFAGRIDLHRIGIIGHSRGAITALSAAAGNAGAAIAAEPRIGAVITLSSGGLAFTDPELAAVGVPVLMMAGASDENQPVAVARGLFDRLVGTSRLFVVVRNAEHRAFDSALCARMQAAGSVRLTNPKALLEDRTVRTLLVQAVSGSTLDYCSFEKFVHPVDIRPLVQEITGFEVTESTVPRTMDADKVSDLNVRLAHAFFNAAFERRAYDGLRFPRELTPTHLLRDPTVESAELILHGDASCPPGLGCTQP